ncbi:MAG: bifunctional tetrahydrofolate synthase/dihydrofolate synthase [Pseudomonadota bacterium]
MQSNSLSDWLTYLERLHPREIDLALDRVHRVLQSLALEPAPFHVLTVGGTNGKGSCVAVLETILRRAGYRTGAYTSPHLVRYNERVRIDGVDIDDDDLLAALLEVERARGDEPLTFFEFGTLAALIAFQRAGVDVAVLEVGMGGRLDAVNVLEPQVAVVTSIGLDHQSWLGDTREAIGVEKAGIFRAGKPAIVGDPDPPRSLLAAATERGAQLLRYGEHFQAEPDGDGTWHFRLGDVALSGLPPLATVGAAQYRNAASALAALLSISDVLPVDVPSLREGVATARARGRFEVMQGDPSWVFDVAHNAASAAELARNLSALPPAGRTRIIVGVLGDKPVAQIAGPLLPLADEWYAVSTDGSRGTASEQVADQLREAGAHTVTSMGPVAAACDRAAAECEAGERVLVMGSFHVVGPALEWYANAARRALRAPETVG